MSLGAGIFLIVIGAILAFAIRDGSGPVNLTVVGIVIMLAGAVGIWVSYHLSQRRRRSGTSAIDPAVEEQYRTLDENLHEESRRDPTPSDRRSPGRSAARHRGRPIK